MSKFMKALIVLGVLLLVGCEPVEKTTTVLLPNVKGQSMDVAKETLNNLDIFVFFEFEETASYTAETVIDYKSPESSGNRITKGISVTLIIASNVIDRNPIISGLTDLVIEPGMDVDFFDGVEGHDYQGYNLNHLLAMDLMDFKPNIEGQYQVLYTLTDLENRTITQYRNIRVTEDRSPRILNVSDMTVMQYFSSDFLSDIVAVDYLSFNISSSIVIEGNTDFSLVGEHLITITATDKQGRVGTKTIIVTVVETYNDPERLIALNTITLPEEIVNGFFLPTTVNGLAVNWNTQDERFVISDKSYIFSTIHPLTTTIFLVGSIDKEGFPAVDQTFNLAFKSQEYYQFPQGYVYDGPVFPSHALNLPFFEGNRGGLIEVTVDRCIDGDTTRFYVNGTSESTRYFNIDTRETYPVEASLPFGEAAKAFTCQMLTNAKVIHLQSDPGDGPRDVHQRLLGWVWVDGELLQYHLVRRGLAEVRYLFGADLYTSALRDAQRHAVAEKQGYWGDLKDPYWPFY